MCRGECKNCGNLIPSRNKFCGECGCPVESGLTNIANAGGDIHGGLYQAGRDVVINSSVPSEPVAPNYEAVPKWRSPITLGILTWLGIGLALLALFPIGDVLKPISSVFFSFPNDYKVQGIQYYTSRLLFVIAIIVFTIPLLLSRSIARKQVRKPLWFGWAINGKGQYLTLEKIYPSPCPVCGGKMRYRKDQNWTAFLECRRNSKHLFEVDQAEEVVDNFR